MATRVPVSPSHALDVQELRALVSARLHAVMVEEPDFDDPRSLANALEEVIDVVNSSDEHLPFATGTAGSRSDASASVSSEREEQEVKALQHQIECKHVAAATPPWPPPPPPPGHGHGRRRGRHHDDNTHA